MKGRLPALVPGLDLGAAGDEETRDAVVPAFRGQVKGPPGLPAAGRLDFRAGIEQSFEKAFVSGKTGPVEGGESAFVAHADGFRKDDEDPPDFFEVALARGAMDLCPRVLPRRFRARSRGRENEKAGRGRNRRSGLTSSDLCSWTQALFL